MHQLHVCTLKAGLYQAAIRLIVFIRHLFALHITQSVPFSYSLLLCFGATMAVFAVSVCAVGVFLRAMCLPVKPTMTVTPAVN